jgi:hypothetical protein
MTASRFVRRLRAKYFSGAWNLGSVKLLAAAAMIAAAAGFAGWRWIEPLSGSGSARAAATCFLLGLALLAAAGLYDARKAAREPLSRRGLHC